MSWTPHFLEGHFKFSGALAPEDQVPVVHSYDLVVKYKDGTKKTEQSLSGFRRKENARREAERMANSRANGSESEDIEEVTYRFRNVYIEDWA